VIISSLRPDLTGQITEVSHSRAHGGYKAGDAVLKHRRSQQEQIRRIQATVMVGRRSRSASPAPGYEDDRVRNSKVEESSRRYRSPGRDDERKRHRSRSREHDSSSHRKKDSHQRRDEDRKEKRYVVHVVQLSTYHTDGN
jgi:hypothetical protein